MMKFVLWIYSFLMKIFDTNIYVSAFWEDDKRHQICRELLIETEESIVIPDFIIAEVVTVLSKRTQSTKLSHHFIGNITKDSRFIVINTPFNDVLDLWHQINHPLSFEDIVVIWVSITYSAEIVTYDQELLQIYD